METPTQPVEASVSDIIPRKPFPQHVDDTVFLQVHKLLAQHPKKHVREAWSENPRLYTLLRMLGYHEDADVFQNFQEEHIDDYCIPLMPATLDQLSSTGLSPAEFENIQKHILSESDQLNDERLLSATHAEHYHIPYGSLYFEQIDKVGQGASAAVMRVRHRRSGKEFACKRISRTGNVKEDKDQLKNLKKFKKEVGVLQRVSHKHLVHLVASFTDLTSFSLILEPVAKDTLKSLLQRQTREDPLPPETLTILRQSFGCLATALAYLHEHKVRHKDIKPGNILIIDNHIYFCDFGIALDWSKVDDSTTEGREDVEFTPRYCALEVSDLGRRNTKSDVWSLGCVFLELVSVIKGFPLEEMDEFLLDLSDGQTRRGLCHAPDAMRAWHEKVRSEGNDSADILPLNWIVPMTRIEAEGRSTAAEVVNAIHRDSSNLPNRNLFLADCCSRFSSINPIESPSFIHTLPNGLEIDNASPSPLGSSPEPSTQNFTLGEDEIGASSGRTRGLRDESTSTNTQNSHEILGSTDSDTLATDSVGSPTNKLTPSGTTRSTHSVSERNSGASFQHISEPITPSLGFRGCSVASPAPFEVKCACALRSKENHIFNASFASCDFDTSIPTIEPPKECEVGENKIQIYETLPEDPSKANTQMPMIWWITRRLVISYLSGNPGIRRCSSFWVPLADLQFTSSGTEVILHWSDCNQITKKRSGNYRRFYDWLYNPKQPNNSLTIRFHNTNDVEQFLDVIRLPFEDGITVKNKREVKISQSEALHILDIGRRGVRNYRAATLTRWNDTLARSKLYIQWPELDLDIHILKVSQSKAMEEYQLCVQLHNVSTPTYHSDVRELPAPQHDRVARFSEALIIKDSFAATFHIPAEHNWPAPPQEVVNMLHDLTGWSLRYFTIVPKFKSKQGHFRKKSFGGANIMLWEKEVEDRGVRRRQSQITFRLCEEADFLWIAGSITQSTNITYSTSHNATVTIADKTRGRLLDVSKMIAIPGEYPKGSGNSYTRNSSNDNEDLSELIISFENAKDRLEFVNFVERFKIAAESASPISKGSSSSVDSPASDGTYRSLPMR